ncbi:hypothetical protein EUGRSUZ_H00979 [Eucalyptus grandis]|uniref:Uncharacterized protein n=2 Tax=Eucalyptus grandis TaxID=71139 RepID=A0ACC3KCG8_EUCGR|nr:hypothetical protein EUGRSUZ_H00979 [Eucalyptus grandis]
MLAKRPGPDVREQKRRHFNFIGTITFHSCFWKLLREVEPELMDALIEATKDGNHSRLRALSVSKVWFGEDDDEEEEDFEQEQEEEEYREHSSIASRWFDGLISKDIQMATEVFSIHAIDFDRPFIAS